MKSARVELRACRTNSTDSSTKFSLETRTFQLACRSNRSVCLAQTARPRSADGDGHNINLGEEVSMHDDGTANTAELQKPSSSKAAISEIAKTSATSPLGMTQFIAAKDVQEKLRCSRAMAYRHLKQATGKTGRGLLRAPVEVWEDYARRVFGCDSTETVRSGTRTSKLVVGASRGVRGAQIEKLLKRSAGSGSATWQIRPTQPRRKRPSATQ